MVSSVVSYQLGEYFQTDIYVGKIDFGLFNRITLTDVDIKDQQHQPLLKAARISAKINIAPLFNRQIVISNVQFYGFNINLYQKDSISAPNFAFIINKFKSQENKERTIPDIRINSVLVRRGNVRFHRKDIAETPEKFNLQHIDISKISATASLKRFSEDSLNINIKKFSCTEHSGLTIKQLKFMVTANKNRASLSNFMFELPSSKASINNLEAHYKLCPDQTTPDKIFKGLFINDFQIKGYIFPPDLKAFDLRLGNADIPINFYSNISGGFDDINIDSIDINTLDNEIQFKASAQARYLLNKKKISGNVNIEKLSVNENALEQVISMYVPETRPFKPYLQMAGNWRLNGTLSSVPSKVEANIAIQTAAGGIMATATLSEQENFQAEFFTPGFNIDSLVHKDLRHAAFNIKCNGKLHKKAISEITFSGNFNKLTYKNYPYQNIKLEGRYLPLSAVNAKVVIEDPNLNLHADAFASLKKHNPHLKLNGSISDFSPGTLNLSEKYADTRFGITFDTEFKGTDIDLMNGHFKTKNFYMETPTEKYAIDNLELTSYQKDDQREIILTSDFINAKLFGEFKFRTLIGNGQKLLHKYIPTFVKMPQHKGKKNKTDLLSLEIDIHDTKPIQKILQIPLEISEGSRIEGYFNSSKDELRLFASLPLINYNGQLFKDFSLYSGIQNDSIICGTYFNKNIGNTPVDFNLRVRAAEDNIYTRFFWDNNNTNVYRGEISANTHFGQNEEDDLVTKVNFLPTEIIINDSSWNIHSSSVLLTKDFIDINDFKIDQGYRHLIVDGYVSPHDNDTLKANLNGINLEYIFNIINFHVVDFAGTASGNVYATRLMTEPFIDAYLKVNRFQFNKAVLGNLDINGGWDQSKRSIFIDADILDEEAQARTFVKGNIKPGHQPESGLELLINTQNINLSFLNKYTDGIFTDMQGRASGWVRVFGPFKKINLEGDMLAHLARMTVNATNVTYHLLNDSVILRPNHIYFKNAIIYDAKGYAGKGDHYAIVNGALNHNYLSNMSFDFAIDANNILGYDQKDFGENPFCGTAYASGRITFNGRPGEVNINIEAHPEENTVFTYNLSAPTTLTSNQFITYKNKNKPDSDTESATEAPTVKTPETDLRLNFNLDITPEATMKILMDPKAGDYIALNGTGNIRANFYNKGAFTMYGTYTVNNGIYKLSLQDVIRKDFIFSQGGTVTFSGIPNEATLNLQAVYTVPSVSLNDLSARSTFSQNNVRVNCIMNLTGKATSPTIGFDFDLPNVNEDEKQMVRSLISTEEEKNLQVIYLLGIGRFYTYDYQNTEQSQSSVAMKSLLSSTLSGQLNQMLSSILGNNSNWNIGTNFSTGEVGWSDMDVEGLLSGRLLDNRLLINGNFGYRENTTTTSNFIGDFDIQWLLTKNGNASLKAYSKTNDRYFTKSSLTTQGIGIAIKKDFNSWRDIFKYFVPKKRREAFLHPSKE